MLLLGGVFLVGAASVLIVFAKAFYNPEHTKNLGPWGDYVGGTLNPVLTFLSFFGILFSIYLQRLDLSLNRKELERSADALEKQISSIEAQNFEAAFFQMLNTHGSIVGAIDLQNSENGTETRGRDCFRVFYTRLSRIFRENEEKGSGRHAQESIIRLSFFVFWKDHQLELGHYFRFLYNIFRFIDENSNTKDYHVKLLRAQLSDQELLMLFYNCLSEQGKNFLKYAIKYQLFDNLPTVRLLHRSHADLMDREAFGNNPMHHSKTYRASF